MSKEAIDELNRYLILCSYRDGEYFLQEEYDELENIIKRNPIARELEEERYRYLTNEITKEEYDNICMEAVRKLKKD